MMFYLFLILIFVSLFSGLKCSESEHSPRPGSSSSAEVDLLESVERSQSSFSLQIQEDHLLQMNAMNPNDLVGLFQLGSDTRATNSRDQPFPLSGAFATNSTHQSFTLSGALDPRGLNSNVRVNPNDDHNDDSDSSNDDEIDTIGFILEDLLCSEIGNLQHGVILNKDGSIRQRQRTDYIRCAK
jgi:hypothetical protein